MFRSIRARELDPGGRLGARRLRVHVVIVPRPNPRLARRARVVGRGGRAEQLHGDVQRPAPAPRSTIAAAFSPDGKLLASTHGDHTVKLIDCRTGRCVRTLTGHRRTPWAVRYHPTGPQRPRVRKPRPSGSRVERHHRGVRRVFRLREAHRQPRVPRRGRRPRRRIRTQALHLQLHQIAPLASPPPPPPPRENPDEADAPAPAPPAADVPFVGTFPSRGRGSTAAAAADDLSADPVPSRASPSAQDDRPRRALPPARRAAHPHRGGERDERTGRAPAPRDDRAETRGGVGRRRTRQPPPPPPPWCGDAAPEPEPEVPRPDRAPPRATYIAPRFHDARFRSEERFAENALGRLRVRSPGASSPEASSSIDDDDDASEEEQRRAAETAAAMAVGDVMRQRLGHRTGARRRGGVTAEDAEAAYRGAMNMGGLRVVGPDGHPARDAASVDAAVRAGRSRRRVFGRARGHALHGETSRVAVRRVGSAQTADWGASHRSARGVVLRDGRALFAVRSSSGGVRGVRAGDARRRRRWEPIPNLVYELRIYSLEERNFGEVLAARAVRAAHCLTSIQFSPTSEHVLLAYGRRHSSLLLLVADGGACVTVHTILEVYRCSDMRLVRALPSAEDEVNVACFHPSPGAWRTAPRRGGCESCGTTRRDGKRRARRGPWRWDGVSRTNSSRCWTGVEWMSRGYPTGADRTRTEAREGRMALPAYKRRRGTRSNTKVKRFFDDAGNARRGDSPDRGVEALVGHDRRADRRRVIHDSREARAATRRPRESGVCVSGIEALRFLRGRQIDDARVVFVRGGAFPPRRVRRRARADNDARGEALAGSYRARRGALGVCALASGVPSTSASRRRGGMPRSGAFADSRAHRDDFDPSRALLPDPTPEGGDLERLPDIADASHPPGAPSDRLPARALARRRRGPASRSPAITRSFIWIVLLSFSLCHACFCGCDTANDDRVVSRTFAQGPQRRRRRRDRRRRDRPDDPRRRADADDDEDDYDPEYAFEADRRRQPRAPPIDDVDDDGGIPPADLFAVAALPRRVAPFPAAAAVVDDAAGRSETSRRIPARYVARTSRGVRLYARYPAGTRSTTSARARGSRFAGVVLRVERRCRASSRAGRGSPPSRENERAGRGRMTRQSRKRRCRRCGRWWRMMWRFCSPR